MTEQLALFADLVANGNGGTRTAAALGLAKEAPPGAERLLRALVRDGLPEDALKAAAALVLELDQPLATGVGPNRMKVPNAA